MKKINFIKNFSKFLITLIKPINSSYAYELQGKIVMKFYPEFLKEEQNKINKKLICIAGTNGKTTVQGLLNSIFMANNNSVIQNQKEWNIICEIAACFLKNNKKSYDYGVFKTDEIWVQPFFKELKPNYLVVTNLFQNRYEKFGGVYSYSKKIKRAIAESPKTKVFLNADDPHLLPVKTKNTIFYGIESIENPAEQKFDAEICTCGAEYMYGQRSYSHIGKFYCERCSNSRSEPKYKGKLNLKEDGIELTVNDKYSFNTKLLGVFNGYNLLSAVCVALEEGIEEKIIQKGIDNFIPQFGSDKRFIQNGKNVIVRMMKNSSSANQSIILIKNNKNIKPFFILNDYPIDGKNISWLYDVDFEQFKDSENEIVISGKRANSMALRLKHAGISENRFFIEPDIKKAYKHAMQGLRLGETLSVLAGFSAVQKLKKIMKK